MRTPSGATTSQIRADDQGSLTVELVLLTPCLFVLVLVILAFGRVSEARQEVVQAASAGAEVAAVSPNPSAAASQAELDATAEVTGHAHSCLQSHVETNTSHFFPGGFVNVTVTCLVALADLSVPGAPGTATISASSTAPIDPYHVVG